MIDPSEAFPTAKENREAFLKNAPWAFFPATAVGIAVFFGFGYSIQYLFQVPEHDSVTIAAYVGSAAFLVTLVILVPKIFISNYRFRADMRRRWYEDRLSYFKRHGTDHPLAQANAEAQKKYTDLGEKDFNDQAWLYIRTKYSTARLILFVVLLLPIMSLAVGAIFGFFMSSGSRLSFAEVWLGSSLMIWLILLFMLPFTIRDDWKKERRELLRLAELNARNGVKTHTRKQSDAAAKESEKRNKKTGGWGEVVKLLTDQSAPAKKTEIPSPAPNPKELSHDKRPSLPKPRGEQRVSQTVVHARRRITHRTDDAEPESTTSEWIGWRKRLASAIGPKRHRGEMADAKRKLWEYLLPLAMDQNRSEQELQRAFKIALYPDSPKRSELAISRDDAEALWKEYQTYLAS